MVIVDSLPQAKILLEHLDWNIKHLREILKNPNTVYYRNASIQRFGFTVDLALKCFKAMLKPNQRAYSDSRTLFQAAFEMQWFEGAGSWEPIVQNYEQVKFGFKNDLGEAVYSNLQEHLAFFQKLHENLSAVPVREDPIQME